MPGKNFLMRKSVWETVSGSFDSPQSHALPSGSLRKTGEEGDLGAAINGRSSTQASLARERTRGDVVGYLRDAPPGADHLQSGLCFPSTTLAVFYAATPAFAHGLNSYAPTALKVLNTVVLRFEFVLWWRNIGLFRT
jgi:hypothetical protein